MLFESTYQPEYCIKALQLLSDGKSKNKVCAELGICKQTLYNWKRDYPEFKLALDIGEVASEAYWEELGADGIIADGFNTAMYMIQMRNRFGWRATDPKDKEETSLEANAQLLAQALTMVNNVKEEVEGMKNGKSLAA